MKYPMVSKIGLAVVSMMLGVNAAQASSNSTIVTVKGRVSAVTCDVQPQGLAGGVFDLGIVKTSDFTNATDAVAKKLLNIKLDNCSTGASNTAKYGLFVNGATLPNNDNVFNDSTSANVGVQVFDSAGVAYKSGGFIKSTVSSGAATTATIPVSFGLIAPFFVDAATMAPEDVVATVKFTADYM